MTRRLLSFLLVSCLLLTLCVNVFATDEANNNGEQSSEVLSLGNIANGEYYAELDIKFLEDKSKNYPFTFFLYEPLVKLYVTTENTDGNENKKYTLDISMYYHSAAIFKKATFGYSKTKYLTKDGYVWDAIAKQDDYVNLLENLTTDDLNAFNDISGKFCYTHTIDLQDPTQSFYVYFNYNEAERIEVSIKNISTQALQVKREKPVITRVAVSGSTQDKEKTKWSQTERTAVKPTFTKDGNKYIRNYILEYKVDDGEIKEASNGKTSNPSVYLVGKDAYDTLGSTIQKSINHIIENSDEHNLKINVRIGLNYVDSYETYYSEWVETDITYMKYGLQKLYSTDKLDIFTHDYDVNMYMRANKDTFIPHDSVLKLTKGEKTNDIESALKTKMSRDDVDYEIVQIDFQNTSGDKQTKVIPSNGLSNTATWSDIDEKYIVIPTIKDWDVTAMKVYRYEDGTLNDTAIINTGVLETYSMGTVVDQTTGKGTFTFNVGSPEVSGTYVFVPTVYASYTGSYLESLNTKSNMKYVTIYASIFNENDLMQKSEFSSAVGNGSLVNTYYSDGSRSVYVTLQPVDGKYLTDIKYKSGEETYSDAEIIETYTVDGIKYPKIIHIPVTSTDAYIPLKFSYDSLEKNGVLGLNYTRFVSYSQTQKPSLTSPTITSCEKDSQAERNAFLNNETAVISIDTDATNTSGNIYYMVKDGAGNDIIQETKYEGAFELKNEADSSSVYTVTAYVKASDYLTDAFADSESVTQNITFRAEGEYLETVGTPSIGIQYVSGSGEADSKFKVTLSSATEGAAIYYTTDGTEPSIESSLYAKPFNIDGKTGENATTVKAIAIKTGANNSEVGEKTVEFDFTWWNNILPNKEYEIPVQMVKETDPNSLSMGHGAIAGNATLKVDAEGNKTLTIPFKQLEVGAIMGWLIDFWYFPDKNEYDGDNWATYMLDYECEYTYSENGIIETVTFPVNNGDELIPTALESNFEFMGKQKTYIKADWSNVIKDVTGIEAADDEIDLPNINYVLSSDGKSYEITLYMDTASEFADANIYYILTKGEDEAWDDEKKTSYTEPFDIDADDANEDGLVNILAVAEYEGEQSMVRLQKISFATDDSGDDGEGGGSGSGSTGGSTGGTEDVDVTKDGKYWVDIALYKASENSESMGDVAFDKNRKALITTKNGTSTIQVASNPVSIPPYYSALKEIQFENKSGKWQYVTDITRKNITANDGSEKHSLDYLALFEFELPSTTDKYVPVKINVPYTPMDGISANVGGFIDARIKLDWSSLKKASNNATLKPSTGSSNGNSSYASGGSSKNNGTNETKSDLVHNITDKNTGIKLTAEKNVFDSKATFEIISVKDGNDYQKVGELLGESADTGYSVYNISANLKKKEAKQTGFATLYIPVGDEDVNKTVIYSYKEETENTNAGLTVLEIELSEDGNYYVVKASEMGTFVVASANEDVNNFGNNSDKNNASAKHSFTDIENHWGKEYIEKAVAMGMFSGVSETSFAPDETATRAMLVTVLARISEIDEKVYAEKQNIFTDITDEDWFFANILWAVEKGIVNGVSDDEFAPNDNITREQMATILYRYIVSNGITLEDGETVLFTDEAEISEYAKEAVAALAKAKIINGKDGGKFDPKGTATRAELATLLVRFAEEYSVTINTDK